MDVYGAATGTLLFYPGSRRVENSTHALIALYGCELARKGDVLTNQGRNGEVKITNAWLKGEGEGTFCSISTLAARRMVVSWGVAYATKKGKDLVARGGKNNIGFREPG